jgi:hypothetical protein
MAGVRTRIRPHIGRATSARPRPARSTVRALNRPLGQADDRAAKRFRRERHRPMPDHLKFGSFGDSIVDEVERDQRAESASGVAKPPHQTSRIDDGVVIVTDNAAHPGRRVRDQLLRRVHRRQRLIAPQPLENGERPAPEGTDRCKRISLMTPERFERGQSMARLRRPMSTRTPGPMVADVVTLRM